MTGMRRIYVCLGDDTSKTFTLKNVVPQSSVIAWTLFNVYQSDMPETHSLKFRNADDWALLYQWKDIQEIETVLSEDLLTLNNYFKQWYLRVNTTNTTTSLFHLDNYRAKSQHQGRILLMRGPRLIHLWGLSPTVTRKNRKALFSLSLAENDDVDALKEQSMKNSKSLLNCLTITALVAAFCAKAFNDTESLKSYLAGGNRIFNFFR